MAKGSFTLLLFVLCFAIVGTQVLAQISGGPEHNLQNAFTGSALTCSHPHMIDLPQRLDRRARLKARLLIFGHDSLCEDAKGFANIAREKEIRKPANKLTTEYRVDFVFFEQTETPFPASTRSLHNCAWGFGVTERLK